MKVDENPVSRVLHIRNIPRDVSESEVSLSKISYTDLVLWMPFYLWKSFSFLSPGNLPSVVVFCVIYPIDLQQLYFFNLGKTINFSILLLCWNFCFVTVSS